MASWNSVHLEVLYNILGWLAFFAWSISFYPQVILNFRRKSVVGLNFDFALLNLTKHSSYLIYNASLFFSSTVQRQYFEKFGFDEMIPVAANDVAFSAHAVLLTIFTLFQIVIYDRGNQKISKTAAVIVAVAWLSAAVCVFMAIPKHSWFWLVSCFNTIQMVVQSVDQNSWVNFYGNIGKTMISLVSVVFDILFMVQHYVLYRAKRTTPPSHPTSVSKEPLLETSSDDPLSQNV